MSLVIDSAEYCGQKFQVEKEITEASVSVILYQLKKRADKIEKIGSDPLSYRNIGKEYDSPFLSWHNLFFCSNNYGPSPDYEYMNNAVQQGKKTAATLYVDAGSEKERKLKNQLPENCDSRPYSDGILYVYHKGTLEDFFDIEEIREIYEKNDKYFIDWEKVKQYFQMPMEYFADEKLCGFSLQSGTFKEQKIITGLVLGYPVESTLELVK